MKLYLVRHGEAEFMALDDERPLSQLGREDITNLSDLISHLKIEVSTVFCSQKKRAQETAHILLSAIKLTGALICRPELDPNAAIEPILAELQATREDIMLVGHMPYMSKISNKLLVGDPYKDVLTFDPGTMACLERIDSQRWTVAWMLNTEVCAC